MKTLSLCHLHGWQSLMRLRKRNSHSVEPIGQSPVLHVNVVSRTAKAGPNTVDFKGTSLYGA